VVPAKTFPDDTHAWLWSTEEPRSSSSSTVIGGLFSRLTQPSAGLPSTVDSKSSWNSHRVGGEVNGPGPAFTQPQTRGV
jgi:hypothetical protein